MMLSYWLLQDTPPSSASKVSSMMVRHSTQPTDNRDKIRHWICEQGLLICSLFPQSGGALRKAGVLSICLSVCLLVCPTSLAQKAVQFIAVEL